MRRLKGIERALLTAVLLAPVAAWVAGARAGWGWGLFGCALLEGVLVALLVARGRQARRALSDAGPPGSGPRLHVARGLSPWTDHEALALARELNLELQRGASALALERNLREGILDSLSAGLVAFGPDGAALFHNAAAIRILGVPPTAFDRLAPADLCPELGPGGALSGPILAGAKSLLSREVALTRPGLPALTARLTVAAYRPEPSSSPGLLCIFEDLTSVRSMQDQIRQLDKLAAIGRFTSSLAHEIRNPLAGIAAGIDYLRRDGGVGPEQQEYIKIISQEIDRLDRIIRNLFSVARPGHPVMQSQSLAPILERVIAFLGPAAEAKAIRFATEERRPWHDVECDEDQIQQVLLNLLKNAVEAEVPGQVIRITVDRGAWDAYGGRLVSDRDEGMILAIENGGEGIAPEDMERIFEPFYTRKPDGTGLGLFVSFNIVKQHGGVIEAASEPGRFTRFRVFLPFAQPRWTEAP